MKKTYLTILLLAALILHGCSDSSVAISPATDPIQYFSLDSLKSYVEVLSGEKSFSLNGNAETILSRHTNYPGNELAANYIKNKLTAFGYNANFHVYSDEGKNVIAIKEGQIKDQYFMICAHYDSMPNNDKAPGADDNASGTSTVLEAARLLAKTNPQYSIIFALWDQEEIGLVGASHYAAMASEEGLDIKLVINIDMIGWDSDGDGRIGCFRPDLEGTEDYFVTMEEVNNEKELDVGLTVINTTASSDSRAFYYNGYKTFSFIENYTNKYGVKDFNPYWHSTDDTIDKYDMGQFERVAKLLIASLHEFAN